MLEPRSIALLGEPWPGSSRRRPPLFHNSTRTTPARSAVRTAFRDSVNLPFVRLIATSLPEIAKLPGIRCASWRIAATRAARYWLRRSQEEESRTFSRAHRSHAGKSPRPRSTPGSCERTRRRGASSSRGVSVFRSAPTKTSPPRLRASRPALRSASRTAARCTASTAATASRSADRAFLARMHPLELWLLEVAARASGGRLQKTPGAIVAATRANVAYTWLFQTRKHGAQDRRLRTTARARRPSCASTATGGSSATRSRRSAPTSPQAIGSSGDRPPRWRS